MNRLRSTHTFALMDVSAATYNEIKTKLEAAGYDHALINEDDKILLDMNGIALQHEEPLAIVPSPRAAEDLEEASEPT